MSIALGPRKFYRVVSVCKAKAVEVKDVKGRNAATLAKRDMQARHDRQCSVMITEMSVEGNRLKQGKMLNGGLAKRRR